MYAVKGTGMKSVWCVYVSDVCLCLSIRLLAPSRLNSWMYNPKNIHVHAIFATLRCFYYIGKKVISLEVK